MKIALFAGHCGSSGLHPYGYGGGEGYTYGLLKILNSYYDTTALVQNGVYPGFDTAVEYGVDLTGIKWKPVGDRVDWVREFDVLININHGYMFPPICRRNILIPFFPQYPEWDTSGYDTIATISEFSRKWIKLYWGRDAVILPPPLPVGALSPTAKKENSICCVGRFFEVPGGNNKNHAVVLRAFREIKQSVPDAKLHFIGTILHQQYYDKIVELAGGIPDVYFHHDLSRPDYLGLIDQSKLVISATGYEAKDPSSMEHFGIFAVEAMGLGTIPLVHNSGGTPEVGAQTWATVPELVGVATCLLSDGPTFNDLSKSARSQAMRFDITSVTPAALGLLESPVVVTGGQRSKIFLPDDLNFKKIGMWTDSPAITTGFGLSTKMIAGVLAEQYDVTVLGLQDPQLGKPRITYGTIANIIARLGEDAHPSDILSEVRKVEPVTVWRGSEHDPGGWLNVERWLKTERPDVLFLSYDIGNVRNMLNKLRETGGDAPLVSLFPVEGQPVIPQYIETVRLIKIMNGVPLAYTKWGAEMIRKFGGPLIDYAYLGADHANFKPLESEERNQLRQAIGWQDKFVCMTVGRNRRTKGLTTIIATAKVLKDMGLGHRFLFYLHTSPYDAITNSSLPLRDIAKLAGVDDMVIIPDLNQVDGIPYDEPIILGNVPDTNDIAQVHRINLSTLSMIERYGCADAYLNLSELEGFGLPAVEAQACGLPVISVDDVGVQREVLGTAPLYVPVSHWDQTWHTGAWLAQVNPQSVAKAVIDLANSPDSTKQELALASIDNSWRFSWRNTAAKIREAFREIV